MWVGLGCWAPKTANAQSHLECGRQKNSPRFFYVCIFAKREISLPPHFRENYIFIFFGRIRVRFFARIRKRTCLYPNPSPILGWCHLLVAVVITTFLHFPSLTEELCAVKVYSTFSWLFYITQQSVFATKSRGIVNFICYPKMGTYWVRFKGIHSVVEPEPVLFGRSRYFLVGAGAGVKMWRQKHFFTNF